VDGKIVEGGNSMLMVNFCAKMVSSGYFQAFVDHIAAHLLLMDRIVGSEAFHNRQCK
jgi:hypothetical protein